MPLLRIDRLEAGALLGIWRMDDSDPLPQMPQGVGFSSLQSANRRREVMAEYNLLAALVGDRQLEIHHNVNGKPSVEGFHISISHTRGWATIILSKLKNVAVDIEYISTRVNRVVERFIRKDEPAPTLAHRLINWSAKETVYKLFSDEDLQYFEMRLHPFDVAPSGSVLVDDLKVGRQAVVHYEINDAFVLTRAIGI